MECIKLCKDFYTRENVLNVAVDLIGKVLVTNIEGYETSGIIIETEAYNGIVDKASHSYNGKRTKRNEVMYEEGGVAYVYLCYGIHSLFNVVTSKKGDPKAVLIRGIIPLDNLGKILDRVGLKNPSKKIGKGPGNVTKCLGIKTYHSGESLLGEKIWIEDRGILFSEKDIKTSKRIGVNYAGEDANLEYRFFIDVDCFEVKILKAKGKIF